MLSFKPAFSLSSFTFIKRLFSSLLYAIRAVSSAYLRLLIFLLAILIPACVSSSLAFGMMYPAYKLDKQGDNIQPWCTPFPIWNQSVVPCPVLTVASWPTYRFLRRHVRWSGIPISWRIFHSLLWSTQSRLFNEAEVDGRTILFKGQGFWELGLCLPFGLLWLSCDLSLCLCVCRLGDVLEWECNEA